MTPAWDWTRFDALRAKLRDEWVAGDRAYVRGRVADARHALENGQPVTMHKDMPREELVATTPDGFVDAWEQGWRP